MKPMEMKSLDELVGGARKRRPEDDYDHIMSELGEGLKRILGAHQAKAMVEIIERLSREREQTPAKEGERPNLVRDLAAAMKDLNDITITRAELASKAAVDRERVQVEREKSIAELLMTVMDRLEQRRPTSSTEETGMTLILKAMMDQNQLLMRAILERIDRRDDGQREDILSEIGKQAISAALNRDPRRELREWLQELSERQELLRALGGGGGDAASLEQLRIQAELKKFELEQQTQKEIAQQEAQAKLRLAEAFAQVAPPVLQQAFAQRNGNGHALPTARAAHAHHEVPEGLHRLQCPACQEEFILRRLPETVRCPACGVVTQRREDETTEETAVAEREPGA